MLDEINIVQTALSAFNNAALYIPAFFLDGVVGVAFICYCVSNWFLYQQAYGVESRKYLEKCNCVECRFNLFMGGVVRGKLLCFA